MRRFVSAAATMVAVFAFAAHAAMASQRDTTVSEDAVKIAFTGPGGVTKVSPYFDIAGAVPGMPPEHRTLTISNVGAVPVAYDLATSVQRRSGEISVADVLVVTIRDARSKQILYRGALADVRMAGTRHIAPGQQVSHGMTIAWPDGGPSDNRYQRLSMTFALTARARPVT